MAKTKATAKTSEGAAVKSKTSEKSETPMTPSAARKSVLGRIGKPYKKSSKEQRKLFKDFLTRLEERDKKLEQSDFEAASEDAMNYVFNKEKGEMGLEWEVEEILDAATIDGELRFMVLWKGHLLEACTWESEANLANSRDAIDDFYVAFPKKTGAPGGKRRGRKSAIESDA